MKLHYGRMLSDKLDGQHGLGRARLGDLVQRFPTVLAEVETRRQAGEYGFYGIGEQTDTVRAIGRFAEGVGQAYDHVLVLGIGGAAPGAQGPGEAPPPPPRDEPGDEGRGKYPPPPPPPQPDPPSLAG